MRINEFASIKNSDKTAQAQPNSSQKRLNYIASKTSPSVTTTKGGVLSIFGF